MAIYDRGLLFGSCAGEAVAWPVVAFAITLAVAGAAWLAVRAFRLAGAWILPWVLLGVGTLMTIVVIAAGVLEPRTARIADLGSTVAIATCHGVREDSRAVETSALDGRFILLTKAKGPPTPLLRLVVARDQVAEIWLGHPGANLDGLARIAPQAIAQYRSWRTDVGGR